MTQRDQGGYIIDVENPVGASRDTLPIVHNGIYSLCLALYHGCDHKEA